MFYGISAHTLLPARETFSPQKIFLTPHRTLRNFRPPPSSFRIPPSRSPLQLLTCSSDTPLHGIDSATSCLTTVAFRARKPYVFQPFRAPIATLTFCASRGILFYREFLGKN